jgi:hypothetical protein
MPAALRVVEARAASGALPGMGSALACARRGGVMLGLGMVLLGLATFAAMIGFIALCDRV